MRIILLTLSHHVTATTTDTLQQMTPSLNIIRFASTIKADCIFLDAQPSLGLVVLPASAPLGDLVESISQLQSTFSNSCVIVHGNLSNDNFTSLQLAIPFGSVRFYTVPTTAAAANVALMHARHMTEKAKLDLQKQYFVAESTNMLSATTARNILFESHRYMNIPPLDTELIASSFPSLSSFMGADHANLHFQVPCEAATAQVLNNFFSASVQLPSPRGSSSDPATHPPTR
mmetsp:Transcript_19685/g.36656  ORF Transcript_19685/g.36656 Transcript_19685/m.36656 type:complete len:231 (+) Transcript_19685:23-715(+)